MDRHALMWLVMAAVVALCLLVVAADAATLQAPGATIIGMQDTVRIILGGH